MKLLKWSILLCVLLYIGIRSFFVDITHDEAYSFFLVKTNYYRAMPGSANTHWLNTLGIRIGTWLLGDAPWQIRIHSLLAGLLYGIICINVSSLFKSKLSQLSIFIILLLNPYLLDFFSLARGYGLATAFILTSLYKTIQLIQKNDWTSSSWLTPFLLAALSVLSNFTCFYFFSCLTVTYLLFIVKQNRWKELNPLRNKKWLLLITATGLFSTASLLFIKYYSGDLEYGGEQDMIHSIFGSLTQKFLYGSFPQSLPLLTLLFATLTFIACGISIYWFLARKKHEPACFIGLTLTGIFMLGLLLNLIFDTPFLLARTALPLYPCIVLAIVLWIDTDKFPTIRSRLATPALVACALFPCTVFFKSINFKYSIEDLVQSETKAALKYSNIGQKVMVTPWHYGAWTNYYRLTDTRLKSLQLTVVREKEMLLLEDSLVDAIKKTDLLILSPPYDLQLLEKKGIQFKTLQIFPTAETAVISILN